MAGLDLAKVVGATAPYRWTEDRMVAGQRLRRADRATASFHVVGLRLRRQAQHPAHAGRARLRRHRAARRRPPAADALALEPDGVFLSNGPGDPEPCDYAIARSREC
jgi:carbamoyl-phosphate synthase small subunit